MLFTSPAKWERSERVSAPGEGAASRTALSFLTRQIGAEGSHHPHPRGGRGLLVLL
jgi:hypothetical protein